MIKLLVCFFEPFKSLQKPQKTSFNYPSIYLSILISIYLYIYLSIYLLDEIDYITNIIYSLACLMVAERVERVVVHLCYDILNPPPLAQFPLSPKTTKPFFFLNISSVILKRPLGLIPLLNHMRSLNLGSFLTFWKPPNIVL